MSTRHVLRADPRYALTVALLTIVIAVCVVIAAHTAMTRQHDTRYPPTSWTWGDGDRVVIVDG